MIFRVGDVVIIRKDIKDLYENTETRTRLDMCEGMINYAGKKAVITRANVANSYTGHYLNVDEEYYMWHEDLLEFANKNYMLLKG